MKKKMKKRKQNETKMLPKGIVFVQRFNETVYTMFYSIFIMRIDGLLQVNIHREAKKGKRKFTLFSCLTNLKSSKRKIHPIAVKKIQLFPIEECNK